MSSNSLCVCFYNLCWQMDTQRDAICISIRLLVPWALVTGQGGNGGGKRAEAAVQATPGPRAGAAQDGHTSLPPCLAPDRGAGNTPHVEKIVQGPSQIRDISVRTNVRFLS